MKVELAGFNVDKQIVDEMQKHVSQPITPETISASYARISRDPRPINELREVARQEVEKARKSNEKIVFTMGHSSIAEHAVYNFDIMGVSRLALEAIEKFRLCSYTEKSQRYITLTDDYVLPAEIINSKFSDDYLAMIKKQNVFYHELYEVLLPFICEKHQALALDAKNKSLLEGWAKEDARYVTALATQGQLGLTINARNLEFMLRRFAANSLKEVQELGKKMFALVKDLSPSLIKYITATAYEQNDYSGQINHYLNIKADKELKKSELEEVKLIDYTKEADEQIASALIFSGAKTDYQKILKQTKKLNKQQIAEIIKIALKEISPFAAPRREWEFADLTFELIISASCFAQLKRHRLATLITQDYEPALGLTIPDSITQVEKQAKFMEIVEETEKLYHKIKKENLSASNYILTNAHRRRVLMKFNARELYHFARLRADQHAQWDIRNIAHEMLEQAKEVMPLTCLLACGRDEFNKNYQENFVN